MDKINTNLVKINKDQKVSKGKKHRTNLIFLIKKIRKQKKWTPEEDELLISITLKYKEKNWKEISKYFNNKNYLQCFSRYRRIRPGIVKGYWTKEEDIRIIELISIYGKAWSKISKILGFRNGKQIRDRFMNVLDPEMVKGKFTRDEDHKLIILYKQYGNKWATISKFFSGRTADMIKNRFYSYIKMKLKNEADISKDQKEYSKQKIISTNVEKINYCTKNSMESHPLAHSISLQSTLNFSNSNSRRDSFANNIYIQEFEQLLGNKNSYINYKELNNSECLALKANNLKYLFFDNEKIYINEQAEALMWNFDDYFTL